MSFYLETALKQKNQTKIQIKYFKRFHNLPFWIWDSVEHAQRYEATSGRCCFNHVLSLPRKDGIPKPLFDYEHEIFDALEQTKYVWIKKARGLGVTELTLRYIAWRCLKDNSWKGKNVCIVTGPRIDTAVTLIRRLKKLFPDFVFDDKEVVCTLNDCHIESYPSHNLDSMRGLTDVCFILSDESDFYPPSQQQESRAVSEGYIAKSNPQIVMISTPNAPEGLFQQIEQEGPDCMYHRIFLPYTRGLGKIYTEEEIAKARQSPSFGREYNLAYIGEEGDVFSFESIERAIQTGIDMQNVGDYRIDQIRQDTDKSMGIDAGFGSSRFGICITQYVPANHRTGTDQKIQVLYAEEFERPDFATMIQKIVKMYENFVVSAIFVDASNPEIITAIKSALNERTDYEKQIANLKQRHPKHLNLANYMKVIPMSFGVDGREMLQHAKLAMDNNWIAIHPKFDKLLVSLRTATATDGLLDKNATSHDDILDAFRLSLQFYSAQQ